MFLKIMNGDGERDDSYTKKFTLIEVVSFSFSKEDGEALVTYDDILGRSSQAIVTGNVYVLNATGKTIESWSPN
jgi:hypothetical protein